MKYFRVATINTPEVNFDPENGFISICGKSTTVNSAEFYKNFLEELKSGREFTGDIHLDLGLEFFNTSSAKCIYDILRELKVRENRGNKISINWFYDLYDKDMLEMGQDFSELVEIDFQFLGKGALTF